MNHLSGRICTIALTLTFIAMLVFSGCADITESQGPHAAPLIYSADEQVYMACGENTVCLSEAQVIEDGEKKTIRAEISEDNGTLIYIADYDGSTGAGTLMGAYTDCLTQPYRIDADVYAAEISADGKRILLIKNVADSAGDLYLYKGAGKPQYVTGGVSRENLGFSPDGKTICYEKKNKLFIQEEGHAALEAADTTKAGSFYVMNGGRLLYGTSYYIYYFANGVTQVEAEDAALLKVQRGSDIFLYQTDEGFFSKRPGDEAKLLIEDSRGIGLWTEFQYSGTLVQSAYNSAFSSTFTGDRFLVIEQNYKTRDMAYAIYELGLGKDKVKIADAVFRAFIDHRMNNVIFEMEVDNGFKTFICTRGSKGWGEPKMILDFPFNINYGDCLEFDSADQTIYCIEHYNGINYEAGNLWRYDIGKGTAEKLMNSVRGFFLIHDIPYVYTKDAIWKVGDDGDKVKIIDYASDRYEDVFFETDGGAFFVKADNEIYYIKDDGTELIRISGADWYIDPSYGLKFTSI